MLHYLARSNYLNAYILGTCLLTVLVFESFRSSDTNRKQDKMRGVCWVGGDSVDTRNFDGLIENNVEWISQTPFGFQPRYDEPEIIYGNQNWYWGERDVGIHHTSKLARARGLKSVLKPHLWLRMSGDGKWRSDIEMKNDEDWEQWFCNYSEFILHFAHIAEDSNIEVLCIGTELYHPAVKFPDKWREIISDIRSVYSGKITYAANFYEEYELITWWDAVDYIGIQGYFPLCQKRNPTLKDLRSGWSPHLNAMKRIAQKYDRQIILTEIGYRNDILAAKEPWLWPSQVEEENRTISEKLQADCYRAFFESCWNEDWLAGAFFWKWYHGTWQFDSYFDYLDYHYTKDNRPTGFREELVQFTPQGREAETVIRQYFGN